MNSEKVKEIKKALKQNIKTGIGFLDEKEDKMFFVSIADILTLINELESENERLLEQRNKTYNIWVKDTEKLKERIAELEKENAKNANCLKQFAERLKEKLEEYRLENEYFIKDEPNGNLWQLNASVFCIEVTQDGGLVDETLKEFIK